MVNRTAPLGSLKKGLKKAIFPQIHHPLPLTPKESQHLLNSITSSFRRNLDKEHPWQSSEGADTTQKLSQSQSIVHAKAPPQSHRPTDRHLESILTNPLFANPQQALHPIPTTLPNRHHVFDTAVAKGLMTTRRAAGYLEAVKKDIAMSSLDNVVQGMAESGAGLRVVQWLRASGAEASFEFLSDRALIQNLIVFIFASRLDEVAWTWLSQLGFRLSSLPQDAQTQRHLASLLQAIMHAQEFLNKSSSSLEPNSLDLGYSTFLRAKETLPLEDPAASRSLKRYWGSLSWASTVNAPLHGKPSAALYETFVDVGRPWNKALDIAHLELHHPTRPDHALAIGYLHDDRAMASAVAASQKMNNSADNLSRRMVSLGTDTVNRLEEIGDKEEASWVSEFMSRTFFAWNMRGKELGFGMAAR
ncbi:hypothetical protein BX600DRAFT_454551 [Xylariales sp. PMI_506]|nr:hypothetical protein BX600DRAFT_454551 [Xylariales sp. PMI_506]